MPPIHQQKCYQIGGHSWRRCTIFGAIRGTWVQRSCFPSMRARTRVSGHGIRNGHGANTATDSHVTNYTDGSPHPIGMLFRSPPTPFQLTRYAAWYQDRVAGASTHGPIGRSWYTSLGHLNSTWEVSPPSCPTYVCSNVLTPTD